jgi:precorrin-6A synthase
VSRLLVIGIGAGDPDHLTVQAIKALNEVDVFFVIEKGGARADLVELRRQILERHVKNPEHRIVDVPDPERDRKAAAYEEAVEDWRRRRAEAWERAIAEHLGEDETGAFLVWGDPALYDSTLAVLDRIGCDYEVIPGISSVQALAARHGIPLNRVGGAIQITTGRRLADGLPPGVDDVVVMLDGDCTFKQLTEPDLEIYWGAYIGTDDELLIAGRLPDVADQIERTRAEARERKGWIMDTYLLRRGVSAGGGPEPQPPAGTSGG